MNYTINKQRYCKHGFTYHRLYGIWNNMIDRCYKKDSISYKYYGAKNIKVCDEWHNIENFIKDMYPSFKENFTLDRIDCNKDYSKDNCRWASKETQQRNKSKIQANNTSGYRGVSWHKIRSKWIAGIKIKSKTIHLGYYESAEDGAKAYDKYVIENNLEHTKNFN